MKNKMKALDIVLFGGAGDLSLRKLLPALYHLFRDGKMPDHSRIIALARSKMDRADFLSLVREKLALYLGDQYFSEQVWQDFSALLEYQDMDLQRPGDWQKLKDILNPIGERDIVYYLAVPPALFAPACMQLKAQGLNPACSRLVVEKPLGEDAASAAAINEILSASFSEKQIYRIDHYLGKEAVQNLLSYRFKSGAEEAFWNKEYIENIQITVAETVGVEGRADFLDRVGLLRDMMQNHLMQILCFVAMERPDSFAADDVRDRKVAVVKALKLITEDNIADHVVRAQYEEGFIKGKPVPSYRQDLENSTARVEGRGETFVALKILLENERWQGVPFYLRTGKCLNSRYADIVVQFKDGEGLEKHMAKPLVLELQPHMSAELIVEERASDHRNADAYEKLLWHVMRQNQAYFVRHDEIMAAWQWIDGIRAAWATTDLPLHSYAAGSMGPEASDILLKKQGHQWHERMPVKDQE